MLSYRVILDVPLPLVVFVSRLPADHRREIGTRNGTRALTCWKQAVFALAWFRDRPDIRRLGQGFGISQDQPGSSAGLALRVRLLGRIDVCSNKVASLLTVAARPFRVVLARTWAALRPVG